MPKTRTLDVDFWDDTVMDSLPRDERLLAIAMITLLADDEGRFVASPTVIKKRVFGLDQDVTPEMVSKMLDHMGSAWPNLQFYEFNGQRYGILLRFAERQHIRYVAASKLPDPDKSNKINHCGATANLVTNSPRVEKSRVEKSRVEHAAKRGSRLPDDFSVTEDMRQWALAEAPAVDLNAATRDFVDYWKSAPGAKGVKLDWVATWRNNIRRCAERGFHIARSNVATLPVRRAQVQDDVADMLARVKEGE